MTMMNGSWNSANRNVTASDSQACASPSSVCQLRSPTNAERLLLVERDVA